MLSDTEIGHAGTGTGQAERKERKLSLSYQIDSSLALTHITTRSLFSHFLMFDV